MLSLRWRDVDLAGGWLHVKGTRTDAADRDVKIRGALRDELAGVRQRAGSTEPSTYVFPTLTGGMLSPENFRNRVLGRPAIVEDGKEKAGTSAVGRANRRLEAEGLSPLPDRITPHSLRRTFASVLYALGEDPGVVMDEMGHTDPGLALRIYRQSMRRGVDEKAALRALVEGEQLAVIGIRGENEGVGRNREQGAPIRKEPICRYFLKRRTGVEPATSSLGSSRSTN
jgi:integrase